MGGIPWEWEALVVTRRRQDGGCEPISFPNVPGTAGYHGLTWPSALWPRAVASRELRYLAVAELIEAGRSMSAMELAAAIQSRGLVIRGDKPNKTVADALRWEVAKGRRPQARPWSVPGRANASIHEVVDPRPGPKPLPSGRGILAS